MIEKNSALKEKRGTTSSLRTAEMLRLWLNAPRYVSSSKDSKPRLGFTFVHL